MLSTFFKSKTTKALELLREKQANLEIQLNEATKFIKEIEKGNFGTEITEDLSKSELGTALEAMKVHLDKIAHEEKTRDWLNTGLATFSDILRNKKSLNKNELSDQILTNLVKYVSANQGAIFTLDIDEYSNQYLQIISCYAYNKKQYLNKRIEIGQGLAGQCVLERQAIHLTKIPNDYVKITSGLGHITPKSVLITPLLINETVFGVIELASLAEFKPQHIEFINRLAENVAGSIKNVKESERIQGLLSASHQNAEELRNNEEEMRQNMEEMQATQEELNRQQSENLEFQRISNSLIKSSPGAIYRSKIDTNWTMIFISQKVFGILGYSPEEFIANSVHLGGLTHPQDFAYVEEQVYKSLESKTQYELNYRLKHKDNNYIYVWEIGEGVYDEQGNPTFIEGVILDVTEKKMNEEQMRRNMEEMRATQEETERKNEEISKIAAESNALLTGINATLATIEFTPEGIVLAANENFLITTKYSLAEIAGKHHRQFVPTHVLETQDYKTFWARLASGITFSGIFERINSAGDTIWLNASYTNIKDASGQIIKIIKFAADITLEKQKEFEVKALLEESKLKEETIQENLGKIQLVQEDLQAKSLDSKAREDVFGIMNIMYEIDLMGNIIYANQKLIEVSKYAHSEIINKPNSVFRHQDMPNQFYNLYSTSLKKGEMFKGIFKNKAKDGSHYWVDACIIPIKDTNANLIKYVETGYLIADDKIGLMLYNHQAKTLGVAKIK